MNTRSIDQIIAANAYNLGVIREVYGRNLDYCADYIKNWENMLLRIKGAAIKTLKEGKKR